MTSLEFVSGVVASSYDKLLTPIQLKSFENISRESFLSLLNTYQYGDIASTTLDQIMLGEELKLKQFVQANLGRDHLLVSMLYVTFDQLFLSSIYKELNLGIKPKNPPENLSTFNEKAVREYLTLGVDIYLNERTKTILDQISLKIKEENLDAQQISDWIIQVLYQNIKQDFDKLKKPDPAMKSYFEELMTIENILLILRSKRYQMGHDYVKANLLPGGIIDLHILEGLYHLSVSEIGHYLKLHYDETVVNAFNNENSDQFIKKVSDAFDRYVVKLSVGYSYQAIGYGSMIDFVMKKRNEIAKLKSYYYESAVK